VLSHSRVSRVSMMWPPSAASHQPAALPLIILVIPSEARNLGLALGYRDPSLRSG
jgi:hypothetical protein